MRIATRHPATRPKRAEQMPRVVRAQVFEVVDTEGRVRARIGPKTRRANGQAYRMIAIELFGESGKAQARLRVCDDGTTSTFELGGHADISMWHQSGSPRSEPRSHISLSSSVAGTSSYWSLDTSASSFPREFSRGPDLSLRDHTFKDQWSLDQAVNEAHKEIGEARRRAATARADGDHRGYQRELRWARKIEGRIQRAVVAYHASHEKRQMQPDTDNSQFESTMGTISSISGQATTRPHTSAPPRPVESRLAALEESVRRQNKQVQRLHKEEVCLLRELTESLARLDGELSSTRGPVPRHLSLVDLETSDDDDEDD